MKRLVSLILCLCLTVALGAPACAEEAFDMSVLRDNKYLKIDVNTEDGIAFVESTFSVAERSFTHQYESTTHYSYSWFDMLIMDYFKSGAYPILRLWFKVATEGQYYYFTSVTITVDGKEYTFSDVADTGWFENKDNNYNQDLLIKFGLDNISFLVALENYVNQFQSYEEIEKASVKAVFHGTTDIETELGSAFLIEFLVFKSAFLDCNGLQHLTDVASPTPMKVVG